MGVCMSEDGKLVLWVHACVPPPSQPLLTDSSAVPVSLFGDLFSL